MSGGKTFIDGVHVQIIPPGEALRPYLTAYYTLEIESETPVSDFLIPEWANLRLIHRGSFDVGAGPDDCVPITIPVATGPTTKPIYIRATKATAFGIGVLPLGWVRFGWRNARTFADRYPPLAELLGPDGDKFAADIAAAETIDAQAAIADQYFAALLNRHDDSNESREVAALHTLLNDPDTLTVESIAAAMSMSHARLARLCNRAFGFPPKLLLRRQRFLRMLAILNFRPYEEWRDFLDPLYVDQSHFIRDFRYFLRMSPRQYLALPRAIQRPAISQRAQVIGTAVQGLHKTGEPASPASVRA